MKFTAFPVALLVVCVAYAQNPGDNIFEEDQILTVELQFSQVSFWDSLVANYTTETYMKADLTVTDNSGTYSFHDIGVRLKGNSSYGHPGNKKSFKIDFNRYHDSLAYDGLKKLNFNNCFKDPTFMREKIMYEISEAAGMNAPRANYANVYMNDTFWGFYEVVEQVDDEFLKTHFDDKSENLFKAGDAFGMGGPTNEADLKYYGTDQAAYEGKYTLENNTEENNWSDLLTLVDFINNTTDDEFAAQLGQHVNIEQLMKNLALLNLFSNLDSYLNSARNYYIYDKDSSGIWEWISWDCNEAFGSYTGGPGGSDLTQMDMYYFSLNRPLLERIVTIEATKEMYDTWYCELKTNFFNSTYIDALIDGLYSLIQPSVYADYNKMYSNDDFETNIETDIVGGGGPGGGTIYGLKSFVTERNSYLETVLNCDQVSINETENSEQFAIYPNPAGDFIFFSSNNIEPGSFINITDLQGNIIKTAETNDDEIFSIDIHDISAGLYLLTIQSNHQILSEPFVKY